MSRMFAHPGFHDNDPPLLPLPQECSHWLLLLSFSFIILPFDTHLLEPMTGNLTITSIDKVKHDSPTLDSMYKTEPHVPRHPEWSCLVILH